MARGKKHDPKLRAQAFELFAGDLTNAEVAKRLGLPETSTYEWQREWVGTPGFEAVRNQKRADMAAVARRIQNASAIRLLDALVKDRIPEEKLPTLYGIATDKALLLEGEPTERTEHFHKISKEEEKDLRERFERLIDSETKRKL